MRHLTGFRIASDAEAATILSKLPVLPRMDKSLPTEWEVPFPLYPTFSTEVVVSVGEEPLLRLIKPVSVPADPTDLPGEGTDSGKTADGTVKKPKPDEGGMAGGLAQLVGVLDSNETFLSVLSDEVLGEDFAESTGFPDKFNELREAGDEGLSKALEKEIEKAVLDFYRDFYGDRAAGVGTGSVPGIDIMDDPLGWLEEQWDRWTDASNLASLGADQLTSFGTGAAMDLVGLKDLEDSDPASAHITAELTNKLIIPEIKALLKDQILSFAKGLFPDLLSKATPKDPNILGRIEETLGIDGGAGPFAARVGDMHSCPVCDGPKPHVGGPIIAPGCLTVLVGGLPAARLGDPATCAGPPDSIAQGEPTVHIGGQPAARVGDMTAHGGTVVQFCATVMIGKTIVDPSPGQSKGPNGKKGPTAASTGTSTSRGPYKTQDEAAKAALGEANPVSIQKNREYGGKIYKDKDGNYYYTAPSKGSGTSFNPSTVKTPTDSTTVGDYHTHGDYSTRDPRTGAAIRTPDPSKDQFASDNFSTSDKRGIKSDAKGTKGYAGYLGTPSGTFRKYDVDSGKDTTL